MSKKLTTIVTGAFLLLFGMTAVSYAQTSNDRVLTEKQRAIVPIAAFTAQGDMERLSVVLNEGLDAGLTINEIKEVLVQMYAYAGFPRSLNGINNFMEVLKEREARGVKDVAGPEASPLPTDKTALELGAENRAYLMGSRPVVGATYEFSPEIDTFLKEHLFGHIFGRDVLDFKSREVATVAALASLGRAENQLRGHLNNSLTIGITEAQLRDLINVLRTKVGSAEAQATTTALNTVLASK
ncbi:MAG: carboxymuconolactone decarboxylase family protein [Sporomusa sp.]